MRAPPDPPRRLIPIWAAVAFVVLLVTAFAYQQRATQLVGPNGQPQTIRQRIAQLQHPHVRTVEEALTDYYASHERLCLAPIQLPGDVGQDGSWGYNQHEHLPQLAAAGVLRTRRVDPSERNADYQTGFTFPAGQGPHGISHGQVYDLDPQLPTMGTGPLAGVQLVRASDPMTVSSGEYHTVREVWLCYGTYVAEVGTPRSIGQQRAIAPYTLRPVLVAWAQAPTGQRALEGAPEYGGGFAGTNGPLAPLPALVDAAAYARTPRRGYAEFERATDPTNPTEGQQWRYISDATASDYAAATAGRT